MSTKKRIFLIRHGQTDFNKLGIIQGSGIDSELNETGWKQAELFHRSYGHVPFDTIYTSALRRTQQSVHPFLDRGFNHEILEELNEINWGSFEGLKTTPERHAEYMRIVKAWRMGNFDQVIADGESPMEMFLRQQKGLNLIMEKKEEEIILICSHGRAMRSFLCLLTGTPLERMDEFPHTNLCLYELEHKRDQLFEIVRANSTEHLNQ
ncbi:MAG: histidine phosphatase family protein [Flavobacteriales bacterium]|nr:histidine phosphatase family protein [Flavobacteriales bacterium]